LHLYNKYFCIHRAQKCQWSSFGYNNATDPKILRLGLRPGLKSKKGYYPEIGPRSSFFYGRLFMIKIHLIRQRMTFVLISGDYTITNHIILYKKNNCCCLLIWYYSIKGESGVICKLKYAKIICFIARKLFPMGLYLMIKWISSIFTTVSGPLDLFRDNLRSWWIGLQNHRIWIQLKKNCGHL
jgi:hypothetical protein